MTKFSFNFIDFRLVSFQSLKMESSRRTKWHTVNPGLIPVKGIYFFFIAGENKRYKTVVV